jgi:hypothetical protein
MPRNALLGPRSQPLCRKVALSLEGRLTLNVKSGIIAQRSEDYDVTVKGTIVKEKVTTVTRMERSAIRERWFGCTASIRRKEGREGIGCSGKNKISPAEATISTRWLMSALPPQATEYCAAAK